MAVQVAIEHRTTYRFDRPIALGPHVVRLRPAPHSRTPIDAYSLSVTPKSAFVNWQQDPFGNYLARCVFPEKTSELSFVVELVATLTNINPFDFFVEESAERFPFAYDPLLAADLEPYLRPILDDEGVEGELLAEWVDQVHVAEDGVPIVDFLVDINHRIARDVAYSVRMEPGVQSPDETLLRAVGSCRDSAWLLVGVLRKLGLAARFVSGYLVQLVEDKPPRDGGPGPEKDFTDLHAWAEVYVPGAGWIGLDATSGLFASEGHIPLAATPHPVTAAAISGALEEAEVEFEFSNTVTRLHEDVRVTKPYTDGQWARVEALGAEVDRRLEAGDVRLTMGGEPTFVSVDDMASPQWTTDADGPDKRRMAAELTARLVDRWAPTGLVHHGQGKWYPGEPLPRWQTAITWRTDGEPVWTRRDLLSDPMEKGDRTDADGLALAEAVVAALGVPSEALLPAYEDALYQVWNEARLPVGTPPEDDIDPSGPVPGSAAERALVSATLDARGGGPAGWVLPLHRDESGASWATSLWTMRRGRLSLTPGTSPLGLRLPLDSVAWSTPVLPMERSTYAKLGPLPSPARRAEPSPTVTTDDVTPRTALCVEVRDGHVFVFLPPVSELEDALGLVAVLEEAAVAAGVPIVVEGYALPWDPRTRTIVVAPDPGVIEVNVQPAVSWDELTESLLTLDADAYAVRLGTETFAFDGTHTGTGGGSHLTLGGITPADSPLLRRPDLLRSMLTYWQHHPSLSYLFSGRFIGPTSQAPRVDEGRVENLYELEVAFAELDRLGDQARPWHVDRLLRHLLTDVTGNTHRAEFCIDKLYSPDSSRGRLGLLELRAFEMSPHPRMALVQALLLRALVARFWEDPYTGGLVRWGTRLHDRYLLPDYVARDAADVVADLRAHGFDFEPAWLDPFLEFRFPALGSLAVAGVELELRSAIEPWHVLGEELSSGGTARYVDSSVERVEVAAKGLDAERHVITCNGVPVPLVSDDESGRSVGAVRFKAWSPYSSLHPTIEPQGPLVFDLVDTWQHKSLGGFTYHVTHPGGRSYDTAPVNAAEAEARRGSRFQKHGHTAGRIDVTLVPPVGTATTLDLRRSAASGPPVPPGLG